MRKSTLSVDNIDKAQRAYRLPLLKLTAHAAAVIVSVWLFVLSLQLIAAGAAGLAGAL